MGDHDDKTAHDFLGQVEFVLGGATGQGGVDAVVPLNSYQLLARKGFVGKDRVKGRLSLTVTEDDLYNKLRSFFYEIDEDGSVVAALLPPGGSRIQRLPASAPEAKTNSYSTERSEMSDAMPDWD